MLRALRKYNRLLLAVFGSGIMIVFLLGNADVVGYFSGLGGSSSYVAKFADGRTVTRQDLAVVQQELQVLERLQPILRPLPVVGNITREPDVFIQLVHEANAAGMISGPGAVLINDEDMVRLSSQTGYNPVVIKRALANYEGIQRYLQHVIRAGILSDRRMVQEGRRQFESADTRLAVIEAKSEDSTTAPTEAQLQSQFDAWKATPPGEGDHGFGYRLPDRVSAEWLIVPASAVEAGVRQAIRNDDTDVRMFWRRNEGGRFPAIGDTLDVPQVVTEAFVDEQTKRRQRDLERKASDLLRAPRRGFESRDGVVKLPDNWSDQRLAMDDLRTALIQEFRMPEGSTPAVETSGDGLIPAVDLADESAFRFAGTDRFGPTPDGTRPRWSMSDLIGAMNEFGESGVPLQEGVVMPVLTTPSGDRIFIRVTETAPNREPNNLAEVHVQVEDDVRRLARYNDIVARIPEIQALASAGGLQAVVDTWSLEAPRTTNIRRGVTNTVSGLGEDADVTNAIINRSIILGVDPLSDVAESNRIVIAPSDQHLAVVVARLDRRIPANESIWSAIVDSGQLVYLTAADEYGGPGMPELAESFTFEALSARHGYERPNNNDTEDDADATTSDDDVADAS
jgi:hypothetical protein